MKQIKKDDILADVLAKNHELIPIVNRFGIQLGVGEYTIEEICDKTKLNIDFLLTILNVYLDEDFFPQKKITEFETELLINYFNKNTENYYNALLPNIEKHLFAFISTGSQQNQSLTVLRKIFLQYKNEFTELVHKDILNQGPYPVELLYDIKNILIKHIHGTYSQNLCYAVIFSITNMINDLQIHNRLYEKVLKQKIKDLESNKDGKNINLHKIGKIKNDSNELTSREMEILIFVASGKTNKEIADNLNISINTVLTHRKNIIKKLGIRTVSGLTFYCITKGWITADITN